MLLWLQRFNGKKSTIGHGSRAAARSAKREEIHHHLQLTIRRKGRNPPPSGIQQMDT